MNRALIISPNLERRSRLRLCLEEGHRMEDEGQFDEIIKMIRERRWFTEIDAASTLSQASALVLNSSLNLCVFLSSEYDSTAIAQFLEDSRSHAIGRSSVYILLLPNDEIGTEQLARFMVVGFHAFLCEPYSIGKLKDTITLAEQVKSDGSQTRLQTAANIMVADTFRRTAPRDYEAIWGNGTGNVVCKVAQMYDYLKRVSGQSLRSPIIRELKPLSPLQRLKRFASLAGNLRDVLRSANDSSENKRN